jgi:hypothetical protein
MMSEEIAVKYRILKKRERWRKTNVISSNYDSSEELRKNGVSQQL